SVNATGDRRGGEASRPGGVTRRLTLRSHLRVAEEQPPPSRGFRPALECAPVENRPPAEIVIHLARQDEAVDERSMEEQLLQSLERTEPDEIAADEAHQVLSNVKVPVLAGRLDVADDFDVARSADPE